MNGLNCKKVGASWKFTTTGWGVIDRVVGVRVETIKEVLDPARSNRNSLDTLLLRLLLVLVRCWFGEPETFLLRQNLSWLLLNSCFSDVLRKWRGEMERLRFRLRSRTSTNGSFSTSECGGIVMSFSGRRNPVNWRSDEETNRAGNSCPNKGGLWFSPAQASVYIRTWPISVTDCWTGCKDRVEHRLGWYSLVTAWWRLLRGLFFSFLAQLWPLFPALWVAVMGQSRYITKDAGSRHRPTLLGTIES